MFKTILTNSSVSSLSVENHLLAFGDGVQVNLYDMKKNTIMRKFKHNCTQSCWPSKVKIFHGSLITSGHDSSGLIKKILFKDFDPMSKIVAVVLFVYKVVICLRQNNQVSKPSNQYDFQPFFYVFHA